MFDYYSGPPSYNMLWSVAYAYASNHGMNLHRCEQFAADYARVFEGVDPEYIPGPSVFEAVQLVDAETHYRGLKK